MQAPYNATVKLMMASLERNLLPDVVIRKLTCFLLAARLRSCLKSTSQQQLQHLMDFVHCMILIAFCFYISSLFGLVFFIMRSFGLVFLDYGLFVVLILRVIIWEKCVLAKAHT